MPNYVLEISFLWDVDDDLLGSSVHDGKGLFLGKYLG